MPKGMRMKMILLLIVMSPGIPEYLTGSSPFNRLFYDPVGFIFSLGLNIALYSTGALLIREFAIRYRKGWGSILALGCAYGIMEEGVSVHTFVQASGSPVGLLAIYGRFAGINWVWALGLTFFHAVFSIGLPLLLLSLAYPQYSREPLLGRKSASTVLSIYLLDVIFLNILLLSVSSRTFPTAGDFILFLLVSIILVVIAFKFPRKMLSPRGKPGSGTKKFYILGMLVFATYTLFAFVPVKADGTGRIPPVIDMILFAASYILYMFLIVRYMPEKSNERHRYALAFGLLIPLLAWAELMEISGMIRLISFVTIFAVIFMLKLRSMIKSRVTHIGLESADLMNN